MTNTNGIRIASSRSSLRAADLRWLFHIVATLYFVRVWVWHISPESAERHTRQLFGGYFRYLTICSFTVQVFQLVAATLVDMTPHGVRLKLKRNADDLSCAVFVIANCVSLLYYLIEFMIPGGVISRLHGPPLVWIDYSTHVLNSVVAWTDITISHPRRFSMRSYWISGALVAAYGGWLYFLRFKTGFYPYGFLNKLPHPYGFLMMIPVCVVAVSLFFLLGRRVSNMTQHIMPPEKLEDFSAVPQKRGKDQEEVDGLKID